MSFWEDSSPVVKGAIIVGVIAFLYLGIAFFTGMPPFPGSCSYENPEVEGETLDGCPESSACVDGECVSQQRGL